MIFPWNSNLLGQFFGISRGLHSTAICLAMPGPAGACGWAMSRPFGLETCQRWATLDGQKSATGVGCWSWGAMDWGFGKIVCSTDNQRTKKHTEIFNALSYIQTSPNAVDAGKGLDTQVRASLLPPANISQISNVRTGFATNTCSWWKVEHWGVSVHAPKTVSYAQAACWRAGSVDSYVSYVEDTEIPWNFASNRAWISQILRQLPERPPHQGSWRVTLRWVK